MEGFVNLKSLFSLSTKGAKTQVWAVLDGCQFSYYRKFDFSLQKPVDIRGALLIKESTQITKSNDIKSETAHGLNVKTDKGSVFFDCVTAEACSSWYNALNKATTLEKEEEERQTRPEKLRQLLEIGPHVKLSRSIITKAYKKLSLKAHPDKGGDPTSFNVINQSYNALLVLQAVEDERENSDIVHFEVDIRKRLAGAGFGIVFAEDSTRRQIVVKETAANIDIVGITEDGGEGLRVGDALIGIDDDDCSQWFMSRIRARLSLVRYKDGDVVRFTFERLVPRNSSPFRREELVSMPPSPVREGSESHSPLRDESSSAAPSTTEVEEKEQKPHIHLADESRSNHHHNNNNNYNNYGSSSSVPVFESAAAFPPAEPVPPTSATWQHPTIEEDKQSAFKGAEAATIYADTNAPMPPDSKLKNLKKENEDLKEQLRRLQEKETRAADIIDFKDRKISALEAESVASNLSIQKLVDEKSSLAFENGELKFRVASLMKIVDSFCHGKASDRQQLDYIVALSDKLAAAQRELRELSTLLATARYSFRVEDERIQESNAIGGGDPRDRLTGDIGAKSALPDAHSRMRVDWNNDRVQRAKRLESQLVAALLKDN